MQGVPPLGSVKHGRGGKQAIFELNAPKTVGYTSIVPIND